MDERILAEAILELRRRDRLRMDESLKVGLADFAETTFWFKLDPWQRHMCGILESLAHTKGRRILIHAKPQAGKTVLLSQRFPAWMLARFPTLRIRIAMYNITHATRHTRIVREIMENPAYIKMFPDEGLRLPSVTSAADWSTQARIDLGDGQSSMAALGLQTGLVGTGPDLILIDDPYASPDDAYSELINDSVWRFWTDSAEPRLHPEANVVCMFHRYKEDDLAGRLMATGKWELYRYSCVADGAYTCPVSGRVYEDPMGLIDGQIRSPRDTEEYIARCMDNELVWLSQFQGRPSAKEGSFFLPDKIEVKHDDGPWMAFVRAWDFAGSAGKGDYTVGVLMARSLDGTRYHILDVCRGQWSAEEVFSRMRDCAKSDPVGTIIRAPEDPGQAGKFQRWHMEAQLSGYPFQFRRPSGDKVTRARPFASMVNSGHTSMEPAAWNQAFKQEYRAFPAGSHDDQVDGGSDAYNELALFTGSVNSLSRAIIRRPEMNNEHNAEAVPMRDSDVGTSPLLGLSGSEGK